MLEEIKSAIKTLKLRAYKFHLDGKGRIGFETLLSLAQRYVDAVEPKMKEPEECACGKFDEETICTCGAYERNVKSEAYDLALADRILWEQKCLDGVEQAILDAIIKERKTDSRYHELGYKYNNVCSCGDCHIASILASAIRQLFGGEGR